MASNAPSRNTSGATSTAASWPASTPTKTLVPWTPSWSLSYNAYLSMANVIGIDRIVFTTDHTAESVGKGVTDACDGGRDIGMRIPRR